LPIPWLAGIVVTFSLVIFAASIAVTVLDANSDARAREIADTILRERLGQHASAR
jgi:uncharacterized membrane protein